MELMPENMLTRRLILWSVFNAIILPGSAVVALVMDTLWPLSLTGTISFLILILIARPHWTKQKVFGWANWVTAIRMVGIIVLGLVYRDLNPWFIIGVSLILLIADGLDGWLARLFKQTSEFGEYFDKEVDAFFILLLSLIIALTQRLGPWILIVGLLRYVFVLALHFGKPKIYKEKRSNRGRFIFILVMAALIACFLPFPSFYLSFAILTTLVLLYSFAKDFRILFFE